MRFRDAAKGVVIEGGGVLICILNAGQVAFRVVAIRGDIGCGVGETLQDVLQPEIGYCILVEVLDKMSLSIEFLARDAALSVLDANFSPRKATRFLGLLRRLETGTMEHLKHVASRSTYYSDKKELSALGLWPPSAGPISLPALAMPPLEELLSEQIVLMEKPQALIDGVDSLPQIESAA